MNRPGDSASEFGDFGYQTDGYRSDDDYRAEDYGTDDYGTDDYRADDYDEPAPAPRGFPAVADEDQPTQAFSVTGRQRAFDNGEWTGSHRAMTTGRRKVSPLVIAALVTVVVVVGAVILWRFFGDALSNRSPGLRRSLRRGRGDRLGDRRPVDRRPGHARWPSSTARTPTRSVTTA